MKLNNPLSWYIFLSTPGNRFLVVEDLRNKVSKNVQNISAELLLSCCCDMLMRAFLKFR
jgi:hypothetical protein